MAIELVLSCEHGGNEVPGEYAGLFEGAADVLDSHRGFDDGALELGETFAKKLGAPLSYATITRLLVDLNRSSRHRNLYSEFSRGLSSGEKEVVLNRYYFPYREKVEDLVRAAIARDAFVFHVSVHSFTPVFEGRRRTVDVGLLYDPKRPAERAIASDWIAELRTVLPGWIVRRNQPYRGIADGFTTYLRKRYHGGAYSGGGVYSGLELEVNQKFVGTPQWGQHMNSLAASLAAVLIHNKEGRRERCQCLRRGTLACT